MHSLSNNACRHVFQREYLGGKKIGFVVKKILAMPSVGQNTGIRVMYGRKEGKLINYLFHKCNCIYGIFNSVPVLEPIPSSAYLREPELGLKFDQPEAKLTSNASN